MKGIQTARVRAQADQGTAIPCGRPSKRNCTARGSVGVTQGCWCSTNRAFQSFSGLA